MRPSMDVPVALPDYEHQDGAPVEVFTIDSTTCAACGYMKAAADEAAAALGPRVRVVERKISTLENVARARRLGLAHLPSIVVNGRFAFSSVIPGRRALADAIAAAL